MEGQWHSKRDYMKLVFEFMKPPDEAQLAYDHAINVRVFSEHKKDSYYWVAN